MGDKDGSVGHERKEMKGLRRRVKKFEAWVEKMNDPVSVTLHLLRLLLKRGRE
jgi:hypothetical protein